MMKTGKTEIYLRWFKAKFSSLKVVNDRPEKHIVYTSARDAAHAKEIFKAGSIGFHFKMKEISYPELLKEISGE